jgi:hypothetical protein
MAKQDRWHGLFFGGGKQLGLISAVRTGLRVAKKPL